jgi:hypothetical protein
MPELPQADKHKLRFYKLVGLDINSLETVFFEQTNRIWELHTLQQHFLTLYVWLFRWFFGQYPNRECGSGYFDSQLTHYSGY